MHLARRLAPYLAMIALTGAVLLVYRASLDPELSARNQKLSDELVRVEARNVRLAAQNGQLKAEIRRLREDRGESLHRARTALGMVRPGEVVYQFEPAR